MSYQKDAVHAPPTQPANALSFEVLEVVSLLAAFEDCTASTQAECEEDYDPFAPGFPGTH